MEEDIQNCSVSWDTLYTTFYLNSRQCFLEDEEAASSALYRQLSLLGR